ncbi:MAG: electron transfer flavoprotein subunit alpha/FixB family protein [Rhodospirillaceae bacterium]|nr:electron transfer flavoprotein subunit alpha/FixB family protein [Rhodospirillaceae bacterium]MBT3628598.1 electron transfer flavoprotein subunit alpha/FixB family protein [Rhodospirillaceae bacterium]MBT5677695.1 electron transfer flavoprotein subunit alpha/FixB family protein [Rhodospirillaceae bacterium]MBT7291941.1 electron transfer flavoprotein subunit alpha/FixB family protein [Rhodospirillaceae bacterium]
MAGANDVWLLLAAAEGRLGAYADGLMREGRRLADALEGDLTAILLGPDIDRLEETLGKFGVNRLYHQRDDSLADYHPEIYTALLGGLVQRHQPRLFLSLAASLGSDLMPRLAAAIGAPLVMNCSNIETAAEIEFTKRVQSGRLQATFTASGGGTNLATLDPEYLPDPEDAKRDTVTQRHEVTVELATIPTRLEITSRQKADPKTVDIREAEIVVALGNGVGAKENIAAYEQFAELIGAALGGSRPVIDSGVLPHKRQIGQTGRSISARLAILCGISGSEYFTKGIDQVATKIAINSDRDAAIFKHADLGIVADVNTLIANLTAHLKNGAKRGGGA